MTFRNLARLKPAALLLALSLVLPACTWFGRRSTNDPTEAESGAPTGDASKLGTPAENATPEARAPTDPPDNEPSGSARESESVVETPNGFAENESATAREPANDAPAASNAQPRPAAVTLPPPVAALAEPGADLRALVSTAGTLDVETLEALGDRLIERTDELSQELDRLRTELANLRPAEIASQRGQSVLQSMERTTEQLDRLREKLDVVARALRARGKSPPPEVERTIDEG